MSSERPALRGCQGIRRIKTHCFHDNKFPWLRRDPEKCRLVLETPSSEELREKCLSQSTQWVAEAKKKEKTGKRNRLVASGTTVEGGRKEHGKKEKLDKAGPIVANEVYQLKKLRKRMNAFWTDIPKRVLERPIKGRKEI